MNNDINSLYRFYKKAGPSAFRDFIKQNPIYKDMEQKVLEIEKINMMAIKYS